jgi:hypothetical protein
MKGKPIQSDNILYLKEYFEDIERFKGKITSNMRDIFNIIHILKTNVA